MGQECQACSLNHSYERETSYPTVALAVPIFDDQHVPGDLWLFKPAHQVFKTQEIRLVRQVANQCAIALRQARLYQTAQRQVAELEQLNHMKDEILSMVSHDLRSPMANIKMAAEMLQVSLKRLCIADTESNTTIVTSMERYIQILSRECHRETELLNDLLDLARVESGNVSLDSVLVQLEEWLHSLLDAFDDGLKNRRQHLHILIPSDLSIHTDLFCLERVVTELLHNACKYTPADRRIWVTAFATGTNIDLSVCNSGVEISPEECDRIFDKFYRIPHNDPWKQGGTGLGLALSKELVHKLRGDITMESSHNQTCFTITLPTHPLPTHPLPSQENSENSLEVTSLPSSRGRDATKPQNQWPNPCLPMSRYADV
ncbi:MAG: GAF domain-containing sensor histidine kinase [Leptolyngbyaceae bacterium]|nr:GAF domain-containing sensor histidine kinase [Leptolyngbyaceae bacterium]